MAKAVAYMRYSSDNQNESSIEYQRATIEKYCNMKDIELVEEYVDMAYTGTNMKRPDFQRMMKDAKRHPDWTMVLVFDMSRFSRHVQQALNCKAQLNDRGIQLVSVTQEFGDTKEGFLLEGMTHLLNDYYSRNNGDVTHASLMVRANKTIHCGGVPPLGYNLTADGLLVINEEEAETVRKIYDMYEKDYSYTRMAKILNDAGIKTKAGKTFTKNSFNSLLNQEKYRGVYRWNRARGKSSEDTHNSHAEKPLEKQVRIEGGCPRIISDEQFFRVQKKMKSRVNGVATSKSSRNYMLGSLKILKCAHCGSYMVGTARTSHGREYATYSCPKHKAKECPTKEIRTEYVDKMVTALLAKDLYNRVDLKQISSLMKYTKEGKRLLNKRRGVEKAIDNVLKSIEGSASELLLQRLNSLEKEKAALDRAVAASKQDIEGITEANRKAICRKLREYLLEAETPDVKEYLAGVLEEVVVSNDDVIIRVKIA